MMRCRSFTLIEKPSGEIERFSPSHPRGNPCKGKCWETFSDRVLLTSKCTFGRVGNVRVVVLCKP